MPRCGGIIPTGVRTPTDVVEMAVKEVQSRERQSERMNAPPPSQNHRRVGGVAQPKSKSVIIKIDVR
jgi:hypothetical protein